MSEPVPYMGSDPFLFVSYAHEDGAVVLQDVQALIDEGFRVWFDHGISPGAHWRETIAERVSNSVGVLGFVSAASVASQYCRQELLFAVDEGKPILLVMLEDVELSPGLRMTVRERQSVIRDAGNAAGYRVRLYAGVRSLAGGFADVDPQDEGDAATKILPTRLTLRVGDTVIEVPPRFTGEFTVGRSAECNCVIPSDFVSRQHGYFRRVGAGYVYGDRSRNGTLAVFEGAGAWETLVHGEECQLPRSGTLKFGDQALEFRIGDPVWPERSG